MDKKLQNLEDLKKVKPNWRRWGRMHEVSLPQAIALSFNVEPSNDLIEFGNWSSGRGDHRFKDEAMQEQLEIALSHVKYGGGLRRTDLSLVGSSSHDWRDFTFITSAFGSWAHALRFGIPHEFPRGNGSVAVRIGANSRVFEIPHASTKLLKALELLEGFGGNLEEFPTQTDFASSILQHCYPVKPEKPEKPEKERSSTAGTIAAFLRPDALRDPDGRAGKSKTRD
jgi:hypothetical protein